MSLSGLQYVNSNGGLTDVPGFSAVATSSNYKIFFQSIYSNAFVLEFTQSTYIEAELELYEDDALNSKLILDETDLDLTLQDLAPFLQEVAESTTILTDVLGLDFTNLSLMIVSSFLECKYLQSVHKS